MSDKKIRSMDKMQLLNIMRQLELELEDKNKLIEKLTAEKNELAKCFEDRRFFQEKAGSLAEASLLVSGVIQSAQEAADVYLDNIKRMETEKISAASAIEAETRLKVDSMIQEAERKRDEIESEARLKADAIVKEAEQKREKIEFEERKTLDDLQSVSKQYMEFIDKARFTLHEILQRYKLIKLSKLNEPMNINAQDINADELPRENN